MKTEQQRTEEGLNALRIGSVSHCLLASLNIGDIVLIKHAHEFKYGGWGSWTKTNYKYLGFERGEYHFENIEHKHEHFRMKEEVEDMHMLWGKYSS